ncbi:MAG: class I SAM-dependent methyltransferase [Firmicutes bacterium]|nr:class I SAM-dependent methyltransferase [Bacillota bacterium]
MRENLITKTAQWAMEVVSHYVAEGDTVVDGTMGNGHDTAALARLVGPEGRVLAFDVQEQALRNTTELLKEEEVRLGLKTGALQSRVRLICDSNANLRSYIDGLKPSAVVFNLGYLPGGDKNVTTTADETLRAVTEALDAVKPGGLVAAVMYSGHEQGAAEKEALLAWARELPPKEYHAAYVAMWNQKKNPPELLLVTKK